MKRTCMVAVVPVKPRMAPAAPIIIIRGCTADIARTGPRRRAAVARRRGLSLTDRLMHSENGPKVKMSEPHEWA